MTARSLAVVAVLALVGCSRAAETPAPKAVPDPAPAAKVDASAQNAADAAAPAIAADPSPFSIVARAPTNLPIGAGRNVGSALLLVQRSPSGGLVVASEFARAHAEGPGALTVDLVSGGRESDILFRAHMVQGLQGMRWVWSDASLSIVVAEDEVERSGPRLESFKVTPTGFQSLHHRIGYWSAAARDGSVLALERTAYEIPNSSMYPKGSGYEQNAWDLKPARIAVLSGRATAPQLPGGVCATSMSAAPDGTVLVTVEKCGGSYQDQTLGALRYPPAATQAKIEWFPVRSLRGESPSDVVTCAASANELYIADGQRLRTWNGHAWVTTEPFDRASVRSLSRAPQGELWAVAGDQLEKRGADGTWKVIPLPSVPADPLDTVAYTPPDFESSHFLEVAELPEDFSVRGQDAKGGMDAWSVDASGDEVVVIGVVEREAFVVSDKARLPVARLPSVPTQRARIAQRLKRQVAASPKDCEDKSFLVFPETATKESLRAALGGAPAGDAGASWAKVGEGTVEGQKRPLVYGDKDATFVAMKRLAALSPKRLCGPAVVDREP